MADEADVLRQLHPVGERPGRGRQVRDLLERRELRHLRRCCPCRRRGSSGPGSSSGRPCSFRKSSLPRTVLSASALAARGASVVGGRGGGRGVDGHGQGSGRAQARTSTSAPLGSSIVVSAMGRSVSAPSWSPAWPLGSRRPSRWLGAGRAGAGARGVAAGRADVDADEVQALVPRASGAARRRPGRGGARPRAPRRRRGRSRPSAVWRRWTSTPPSSSGRSAIRARVTPRWALALSREADGLDGLLQREPALAAGAAGAATVAVAVVVGAGVVAAAAAAVPASAPGATAGAAARAAPAAAVATVRRASAGSRSAAAGGRRSCAGARARAWRGRRRRPQQRSWPRRRAPAWASGRRGVGRERDGAGGLLRGRGDGRLGRAASRAGGRDGGAATGPGRGGRDERDAWQRRAGHDGGRLRRGRSPSEPAAGRRARRTRRTPGRPRSRRR